MIKLCLIGILVDLLENNKLTAKFLSEKYEVSTRSIYRYIDLLICNGIPISTQKGVNGGIYLDKNFCLSSTILSKDEKNYLFSLLAKQNDEIASSLKNKLNLNHTR